jgi:hypothetical protein
MAVPDDVIPVKEMTNVMWDFMLADEMVYQRYPVDTSHIRFDTSLIIYPQIATAHKTTQQQFKKSMQFYQSRPDLLQIILDSLQQRATYQPKPPVKDSSLQVVN